MNSDPLKLLFVVDGRSPIALNWVRYFVDQGHEVHLASMYPCQPDLELASLTIIPVAFSGAVEAGASGSEIPSLRSRLIRAVANPNLRTWLRQRFVPRSLPKAAAQLQLLINALQPDIIHAMRVPYEGMLAALACSLLAASRSPLLISIWGNDFTLHAPATHQMARLTRFAMQQADALHSDCYRDQPLAQKWGFDSAKPAVVLPGGGGIQLDIFKPIRPSWSSKTSKVFTPIVINPRGLRAYVRNDTFFRAIPLVLARHPKVRFVCPTMAGQPEAQKWVESLGISQSVDLLPRQSRLEMAALFQQAQVVVSPSTHDGTPNTLLEAMACGCFPVVGDIEPLQEWINQGENGFLVDPTDPQALAEAICEGLQNPELRARSQKTNARLIAERAEYGQVMRQAEAFYLTIIGYPADN
jgi:glycosyltransferase involved in cell wall biosynthesis